VLAPHPDDFDAIAVSMRYLHQQEHEIHVAVLTSGANDVEDGWNGARCMEEKKALREAEQQASCSFFGLPMDRLVFLHSHEPSGNNALWQNFFRPAHRRSRQNGEIACVATDGHKFYRSQKID